MKENSPSYYARIVGTQQKNPSSNTDKIETSIIIQRLGTQVCEVLHMPTQFDLNILLHSVIEITPKTNDQGELFADIHPLKRREKHYSFQPPELFQTKKP